MRVAVGVGVSVGVEAGVCVEVEVGAGGLVAAFFGMAGGDVRVLVGKISMEVATDGVGVSCGAVHAVMANIEASIAVSSRVLMRNVVGTDSIAGRSAARQFAKRCVRQVRGEIRSLLTEVIISSNGGGYSVWFTRTQSAYGCDASKVVALQLLKYLA